MAKTRRSPKTSGSRSLTLDAILDESLRIVRDQGVTGLTMRAVAAGLGVTPMAVYYYVADKDDLLRLVVDKLYSSFGFLATQPDQDWQDSLREYLVTMWERSRRYPGLSTHIINQPGLGVTPERLEKGLAFFDEVGFPPAEARLAWSFAVTYIHGRISVDAHLSRHSGVTHLDGLKARDYVDFGVGAVISGLEEMLGTAKHAPTTSTSTTSTPNPSAEESY
jgi:TetR/AcrR family transcriptional regulator, tetracycline repressor protein